MIQLLHIDCMEYMATPRGAGSNEWFPPLPDCIADELPDECARHRVRRYVMQMVTAERERCAKLCEEVESQAWALWKTTADPIEQGRNIGAQHCADAIRA